jgi:MSHA pilin protein MshC
MRQPGFTLVELIVILMIMSILAAVALPRFFDRTAFDRRGFHDQAVSALRYAQKAAIAQRRHVCVTFAIDRIALAIATNAGASASCAPADTISLAGPDGMAPYLIAAAPGVSFADAGGVAAVPASFHFNALGQASVRQDFRVSGVAQRIIIERDTGYVHP